MQAPRPTPRQAAARARRVIAWLLLACLCPAPLLATGVFRKRDFSPKAAWNTPLDPKSRYQTAPGVSGSPTGFDTWDTTDAYTVPCYIAAGSDAKHRLLFSPYAWSKVAQGLWQRSGNSPQTEADILANASPHFPPPGNPFSSISATAWVLPDFMQGLPAPPPQHFRYTTAMLPPSGTDGHMAVGQPDGRVVETYATILLSTGDVVALSYAVTHPSGRGDGHQNGQTAAMLPNYAGLIQDGDMTTGIDHAMAISVPASLLTTAIAAPAATFDRDALTGNPPYSGALPMGARLGLPPGLKIGTLSLLTPEGRAIARAAATYGFIVGERGGDGITLHVRPNSPTRDPALHAFNAPLARDLNTIFDYVVYFPK